MAKKMTRGCGPGLTRVHPGDKEVVESSLRIAQTEHSRGYWKLTEIIGVFLNNKNLAISKGKAPKKFSTIKLDRIEDKDLFDLLSKSHQIRDFESYHGITLRLCTESRSITVAINEHFLPKAKCCNHCKNYQHGRRAGLAIAA